MNKPLTNKEFREFLQEFKKASRLDTAMATVQTKETKNVFGDNSKTEKQLDNVNKNLESLLKGIEKLSGNFTKSNDKIVNKLQDISKGSDFKSLDKIKDTRPTTLKEELKSTVAGAKRFGSSIVSGVKGIGEKISNVIKNPMSGVDAASGFINKIGENAQDILNTSKDYTIEGSRFGKAYSKATGGSADVGMENFNQLAEKEKEIKAVEERIKQQTDFGFEANQKDRDELDSLKKQYSDLDLRNKKAPIEKKGAFGFHGMTGEAFKSQEERDQYFKENPSAKPVMNDEQLDGFLAKMGFPKQEEQTAPIERALSAKEKFVKSTVTDEQKNNWGDFAATRHAERQYDDNVKNMGEFAASRNAEKMYEEKFPQQDKKEAILEAAVDANVEDDNVESPQEIIAETSKDNLDLTKQLLDTTKESLTQLKSIREALTSTAGEQQQATPQAAPTAAPAAAESSGPSLLDQFGNPFEKGKPSTPAGKASTPKASLGSRIVSGAKGLASKIPGGALAGAGVGIAGMAGEYVGGKLEEAGYEKSGAAVSTLGTAAKYGGMGMAIGSIVPGVGTAIGGAIGGAVGLGMGLYENAGKIFGGGKDKATSVDPELEKAKDSKQAKQLQKLAGEGKYRFVPAGRNVDVYDTESGELVQSIQAPDRISGKELINVAGVQDAGKSPARLGREKEIIQDREKTNAAIARKGDKGQEILSGEATAAKPVDTSKMHPMARREYEAMQGYNNQNVQAHQAELAASKKPSEQVSQKSVENAAMRDEMSTSKTSQPIVSNNVQTSNNTNYVPIKSDPRPSSRGSALDRYSDRVAAY